MSTRCVVAEIGNTTTSGAVTSTIVEAAIPDDHFGIVSINVSCEQDGTPANSFIVQGTYAVSATGGVVTIRDDTAVPLVQDAGIVGMSFLFDANGQNVRIQGMGVVGVDLTWVGSIDGLLLPR